MALELASWFLEEHKQLAFELLVAVSEKVLALQLVCSCTLPFWALDTSV